MGRLLSSAFSASENNPNTPKERWIEAAVDGLLTVEGERFMLSLPISIEPNITAILRPQIINELAELRRFKNRIIKRIEELLCSDFRHGIEAAFEIRLKEELCRLRDWLTGSEPRQEAA
jgi:hypothetical protein